MLGCKQLRAGQTPARANPQDGPNPSIGQTPSQERRDLLTQKSARKVLTAALLFQGRSHWDGRASRSGWRTHTLAGRAAAARLIPTQGRPGPEREARGRGQSARPEREARARGQRARPEGEAPFVSPQQPARCRSVCAVVFTCDGALGNLVVSSLKDEQAASFWPNRCSDMASFKRLSGALALLA